MITRSILRPVLRPVTRAVSDTIRGFNPRSLFASGEQGIWLDPSDFSTLFQDSAGTTPVTAVGQPVGLALDKSGRGNHATQTTGASRPTVEARVNLLVNTANQNAWAYQGSRFTAGTTDGTGASELTASIEAVVLAGVNTDYPVGASYPSPACIVRSIEVKAGTATHFRFGSAGDYAILRLSDGVIEYQQNLTTATVTQSDDGYWRLEVLVESATWTASGLSNYISWGKGISGSVISTTGQIGSTVYVRRPSFVVKGFGFRGSIPYQRVNSATDYVDVGAPRYLQLDGTDDGMATPSIDFTGTDKMTVWVGVRKLSDAAAGMVVELSTSSSNSGSFYLAAPVTAAANFAFNSRGTSPSIAQTASSFAAPLTAVLTGSGNISGDSTILRVNGVQAASSVDDQGTGNYGNYPLYIGRRGGTSSPFNGRIYQLIIRGAASNAGQIAAGEAWCNAKTRAY